MSHQTPSLAISPSPQAETVAHETRLRGRWLVGARATWLIVVAWMITSFVTSLPSQLHTFQHPSAHSTELAPGSVAALHQVGVSLAAYAWIAVLFGSLVMLAATALALILFWRRGDDWMALLVSLLFPAYCLLSISPSESFRTTPTGSPLAVANTILLATVTFGIIYAVFMLFPSGRFVPSWSWVMLAACVIWFATRATQPTLAILFLGYPIFLVAAVVCQIYRYRKVSTPVQRQQSRWAVFGLVTALVANQAFWWPLSAFPLLIDTVYPPIAYLVLYGSVLFIPVTFFISIQRYRLYEIDVIIRRTLIYGALTATLAIVYFAVVLGVQTVARPLTGQTGQSPVLIAATTLLVAALFSPLHRWLQALIDRAFYRTKYNTARTLTAFGDKLRLETDLEELREAMLTVVQQTMRPTHATLWLRRANQPPPNRPVT